MRGKVVKISALQEIEGYVMRGRELEAPSWEPGYEFPSVSLGPFAKAELLRMAELTRDFHPVRLVPQVAEDAGFGGLLLHPAWISGIADTGIRTAFPCGRVIRLMLIHRGSSVHTDILSFELTCQEQDMQKKEVDVSFLMKNQRGDVVAQGEARICMNPRPPVKNVSRETSDGLL